MPETSIYPNAVELLKDGVEIECERLAPPVFHHFSGRDLTHIQGPLTAIKADIPLSG